ncbi:MAG TPA: phosphonoacetaldehyde reductase [Kiritimatiellia bacterium]|nr:phosphonoacetaldehyde reductase [Kiritimatiellia bacterium]HRZ12563.1 phosphonoacetaldehyde reductase [Kiritimatiellia bacterium]HSA17641.1 phosphonoacetaldehyde reductase [Kiritimatiellia bacterium]
MSAQTEYLGAGSVACLGEVLQRHAPRRVFLVTGRASYEASGARAAIEPLLGATPFVRFHDFESNPRLEDVERGIRLFRESACDLVVAAGGGSVMDMAKSVRFLAAQEAGARDCLRDAGGPRRRGAPLAAIPTTAGSGSEATRFAVLYVDREKESLEHEFVLPDYAIVDPGLTARLSPRQTAISGLDALCQATESFWSVLSTPESQGYARRALGLVLEHLDRAVNRPDAAARAGMAEAAHVAGKAICISKTTACHAVSYPLTSYFGVPHGLAAALTLPSMLAFNAGVTVADCQDARGAAWVGRILGELMALIGADSPAGAAAALTDLMRNVGMPVRLGEAGIRPADIPLILDHGFNPGRVKNNPRRLTREELKALLDAMA